MESQVDEKMENEMETVLGFYGLFSKLWAPYAAATSEGFQNGTLVLGTKQRLIGGLRRGRVGTAIVPYASFR